MAGAWLGWLAAGAVITVLFLSQSRWFWLALPIAAALPAVLASSDFQAGLAAFNASGIVVLGFLFFGRDWWGFLMIVASAVLLTLLLAPEAFTAIGLAFVLIVLVAATMAVAGLRVDYRTKQKQAVR